MTNRFQSEVISGSIVKLLKHKEFINGEKTPISAQLVLTNSCNLRCIFCVNKGKENAYVNDGAMDKEAIFRVISDLKDLGVKGIEFTGGGEPLMNPFFNDIVIYTVKIGILPSLVTNGVLLENVDINVLSKMDWIRISINSGRKNYKNIHGVDKYDAVMNGLKKIDRINVPNKGVSHIFCDSSNIQDTQDLLDDLQQFSLNYFRFSTDVLKNGLRIDSSILKSPGIPIIDHSDRSKKVPLTCGIFYYKPVIDYNGEIYPCCINLYRSTMSIGNVHNIKKIWKDKNVIIDTKKCTYCIYTVANNLIHDIDCPIKNVCFI